MKSGKGLVQHKLFNADFPAEIITGIPVLEVKGTSETAVWNHRGILAYQDSEVRIASSLGPVTVSGRDLIIFRMNRERIILHGVILRIEFGADPC